MPVTKVFGITGRMRSGKDSFFTAVKSLNKDVFRLAFADPLKKEVALATGVTVEYIDEHKALFRPVLQWWGTDFRRKLHGDDYWIRQADLEFKRLVSGFSVCHEEVSVFFTDTRFPNEADYVRSIGGKIIKVVRGGHHVPEEAGGGHASESEIDNIRADEVISAAMLSELNFLTRTWSERNLR